MFLKNYLTYFDANYLVKGLAMIRSLQQYVPECLVTVVCLDDEALQVLRRLALKGVTPLPLRLFEVDDAELATAKANRSAVEYYWTLTPTFILRVLEQLDPGSVLTYVDADMLFYASSDPIGEELGEASVLIHRHNFPKEYKHLEENGIFNVGLMCFRNDPEGRRLAAWWRERCLDWCYARCEDGKMGDQKYLESFQRLSAAVVVSTNPGVGVAPWNQIGYNVDEINGRPLVNGHPVVFYHYHGSVFLAPGALILSSSSFYRCTVAIQRLFAVPYLEALQKALDTVRTVAPDFAKGFNPSGLRDGVCVILRNELEPAFADAFPVRVRLTEAYLLGAGQQLIEFTCQSERTGRSLQKALAAFERFPAKPRLLNLGCGGHFHQDWLNVDIAPAHPAVYDVDLRKEWPLPTDFFDMVYHSHVLEHMSREELKCLIRRCFAVLKPGGIIRLAVSESVTKSKALTCGVGPEVLPDTEQPRSIGHGVAQLRCMLATMGFIDVHETNGVGGIMPPDSTINRERLDEESAKNAQLFIEAKKSELAMDHGEGSNCSAPWLICPAGYWNGAYPDWKSALCAADGYDADRIFRKVYKATRAVRDGKALWERDTVLFYHPEYYEFLVGHLLRIAKQSNNELHVLDFGGALGSSYMQNRKAFEGLKKVSWNVVEQKHFVDLGVTEFATEELHFYKSLHEALHRASINVVILSGVLQYLERPYAILHELAQYRLPIIIARTPILQNAEYITIQVVPPSIYDATYPMWWLDQFRIESVLQEYGYTVLPWKPSPVDDRGFCDTVALPLKEMNDRLR